ncbi:unnamed protein product, partial [Amoebophrya sp. A25]|eukprot:GSA25T00010187001.1
MFLALVLFSRGMAARKMKMFMVIPFLACVLVLNAV